MYDINIFLLSIIFKFKLVEFLKNGNAELYKYKKYAFMNTIFLFLNSSKTCMSGLQRIWYLNNTKRRQFGDIWALNL